MTPLLGPSLLLLALVPSALATIISDGGFACIFNANGVAATPAQRGLTAPVPALSTLGSYDVRREGAGTTPRRRPRRRAAPPPFFAPLARQPLPPSPHAAAAPPTRFRAPASQTSNLGCAPHTPPSGAAAQAGGPWPLTGTK